MFYKVFVFYNGVIKSKIPLTIFLFKFVKKLQVDIVKLFQIY